MRFTERRGEFVHMCTTETWNRLVLVSLWPDLYCQIWVPNLKHEAAKWLKPNTKAQYFVICRVAKPYYQFHSPPALSAESLLPSFLHPHLGFFIFPSSHSLCLFHAQKCQHKWSRLNCLLMDVNVYVHGSQTFLIVVHLSTVLYTAKALSMCFYLIVEIKKSV